MTPYSALFVDRDGTVIEDVGYPSDPTDVRLLPGAAQALARIRSNGVPIIMITNQSGIGRGLIERSEFDAVQTEVVTRLREAGAAPDAVYVCPHAPDAGCECRKPAAGLFERAAREHGIDLSRALYVGDRLRDVAAGVARGGLAVVVATGAPVPDELPDGVVRAHDLSDAIERALTGPRAKGGGRMRVVVFASGGGSNFQALIDRFSEPATGVAMAGLVASRETAGAIRRAEDAGIPWVVASAAGAESGSEGAFLVEALERLEADLVVLAGYLRLVPPEVVRGWWGRVINIHPALLPAFGGQGMYGARVHEAVVESGVRVTGATVHFVDEAYDRGPIIAQWPVPVLEGDTPANVARRVLAVEHQLLPDVVAALSEGAVGLQEDGRVRWRRPWIAGDRFRADPGT